MSERKIHKYFDITYSKWNIRDFLIQCDLEPLGQKTACYNRSLETIANYETDPRRGKAQELLNRYKEASFEPSHEVSVGAYTTYEVFLRSRLRTDLTLALLGLENITNFSKIFHSPFWHLNRRTPFLHPNRRTPFLHPNRRTPFLHINNDPDYTPRSDTDESTSDASGYNDDLDCNNEKDSPKIDKVAFCKTHDKLKLSTGKIVDILFKFCKDMDYEHHAHSYIVGFDDEDVKMLFTDEEWNELTKDRIGVPSFPRDIAEELAKYGSKTLKELRIKVMKSFLKEEEEYDVHKHYNQEWIQMTMRTLCNLFENVDTPLVRTQYEDWFTVALFGTCIDFCIRDAQLGTDIKRTDAPSLSSANRKNRHRKANTRKFIGRKIDGICN
ncbi:hypothetical protein Glove_368g40 [Diversispora epigaea]|uniref:Uncharacterized protein n=1 Tax=Diversispora epigaea TaxID=1348612 RepID=A0A397HBM7_9GLOM|nr:hypothetical protein Glove_368g40 [Diversispora epigaea]